jgi:transposase
MLKYRIKRKNKLKDQSGKKIKKRRRNIVRIQDILYHMARWNVDVNFFFLILILMLPFKQLAGPC